MRTAPGLCLKRYRALDLMEWIWGYLQLVFVLEMRTQRVTLVKILPTVVKWANVGLDLQRRAVKQLTSRQLWMIGAKALCYGCRITLLDVVSIALYRFITTTSYINICFFVRRVNHN